MYSPFSGVEVTGWILPLLGFTAGATSGFWGVGGGWVITPALFILGLPMNLAIGTSLSFIYAQGIISSLKHKEMGNVNFPVGFLILIGMLPSVELGVRTVDFLTRKGNVDLFLGYFYIFFLFLIFLLTFKESYKAKKRKEEKTFSLKDRCFLLRMPPILKFSGEEYSLWSILITGILGGFFSGLLGIGGGILYLPLMIYFLGLPTKTAVGTSLFNIVLAGAYGTFSHAYQGNVDLIYGLLLLFGGVIGARLGALATKYTTGANIRFLFSLGVGATCLAILLKMLQVFWASFSLIMGVAGGMSIVVIYYLIKGKYGKGLHKLG
ncbi:MAG: sulfite exporter TauE/SafE family protein [Caldiserica bacterium]|nr:sulfite exporter TauE/SafE family protein [Caldisericota bacterium]